MKLTFLGTSSGYPTAERHCSSMLLEVGERMYLIDTGAPVADIMIRKGKRIENVKAVFNSHFHGDHYIGGLSLLDLCCWWYKKSELAFYIPDKHCVSAVKNLIESSTVEIPEDRIKVEEYGDDFVYDDGYIRLEVIPTKHTSYNPKIKSYAFYVCAEGKKLLFTSDLSMGLEENDFPEIAYREKFDLIVTECAHFSVEMLEKCMSKVKTDIFAVTHVHPAEKYDEMEKLRDKYSFELLLAKDDDEILF